MKSFATTLVAAVAAFALCATSAPVEVETTLAARAVPSGTNCGGKRYSGSDIQNAIYAAQDDDESGNYPGNYPHQFNNYEGLPLQCGSGPWYEFPLKSGSTYTGGSPGADRVVYRRSTGEYCASITHTGASQRNGFVSCNDN